MSSTKSSTMQPRLRLLREEFWVLVVPLATLLAALGVFELVLDVRRARTVPADWGLPSNLWLSSAVLVVKLLVIAFFVHRSWSRHLGAKRGSA